MNTARSANGRTFASQRAISLALSVAIHALILVLAISALWRQPDQVEREVFTAIRLSPAPSAAAQAEQPKSQRVEPQPSPVPTAVPPPLLVVPRELLVPSAPPVPAEILALLANADANATGGACDLTAPVQAALRLDPIVQRLLPSIPPSRRSVAMAIALWNREWVPPDAGLNLIVLDAIRSTVATTVEAASPACRSQVQAGPRLVYLPGAVDTILAVGSGEWTWQDVADTARPVPLESILPARLPAGQITSRSSAQP